MWSKKQFERLYQQHSYAIYRRCWSLLRNEDEARDMMQEIFLQFLEKPQAYRGRSKIATYLYAIATNKCLNKIRNQKARDEKWQQGLIEHIESKHCPHLSEQRFAAKELVHAILNESDETMAAIALCYFAEGLTQSEVAKVTGLSRVSINQKIKAFCNNAQTFKGDL